MKKFNISFVFVLVFLLITSSCSKQIDLEPTSQISNASFWKTEADANGALYGMYVRLRTQSMENLFLLGEARSEIMGNSLSVSPYAVYFNNTLSSTTAGPAWSGFYTIIHDANLIIKNVPAIKFSSEAAKNTVLAQAYATRAYAYYVMTRTWGDLPLVTSPTEAINAEAIQLERTSKAEIFKVIKADIEQSIKLFPNNTIPSSRSIWSKPAVYALKADVNLWTGKQLAGGPADFQSALEAIAEIEKADIQLLPVFADVFKFANKGNKEILMSIRYQDLEVANNIGTTMYISAAEFPANLATDADTKTTIGIVGGNNYWAVTDAVRNQFTTDDSRKKVSFTEVFVTTAGVRKYYASVVSKFDGEVISGVRKFLDDFIIYRFADVILMKAEAKNALGQDPSVEMNLIRKRAYGSTSGSYVFVNGSKIQNDDAILKERLLELIFEGKRWWDLIRFGKAFDLVPSLKSRVGKTDLFLFPIAETILSLETKVKQNPGY